MMDTASIANRATSLPALAVATHPAHLLALAAAHLPAPVVILAITTIMVNIKITTRIPLAMITARASLAQAAAIHAASPLLLARNPHAPAATNLIAVTPTLTTLSRFPSRARRSP